MASQDADLLASTPAKWVGQSLPRLEDARFVTGRGQYVDDIRLPGMLHAAVLRAQPAHALLKRLDTHKARALPGVLDLITGKEIEQLTRSLKVDTLRPGMRDNQHYALATDKIRYAGEPLAIVAAVSRYVAEDALDLIEVEYEPLPVVMQAENALQANAPLLYEDWGDNIAYSNKVVGGEIEAAFAQADDVLRLEVKIPRLTGAALETRGAIAHYEPGGNLTLWTTNQSPHHLRSNLAEALGLSEARIRVIVPDMGGAFGAKHHLYPEDVLVALLALRTGRPVKWIEDRREHFLASDHAREQIHNLELAYKKDGTLLAIRGRFLADIGARLPRSGAGPVAITTNTIPGPYKLNAYQMEVKMVVTNKVPLGGLRGYGSAQSTFVIERAMDALAAKLGLDPAELRLKNLVPAEAMPYRSPSRMAYDSGDYPATLRRALTLARYDQLRAEEKRRQAAGELFGVGVCFFNKSGGLGPSAILALTGQRGGYEQARLKLEEDGRLSLFSGLLSHGQGLETSLAQLCADELGLEPGQIRVVLGDTASTPHSPFGTSASRSIIVGGGATLEAANRLREKILRLAGHLLEANPADLELAQGSVNVKGTPGRSLSLAEVAHFAYRGQKLPPDFEPGLEVTATFDPKSFIYSFGAHIAAVSVDRETGLVKIEEYVALHDVGRAVNPLIVRGQLIGGLAQGLGGAIYEEVVYGENGALLSGTLVDYLLPLATDMPPLKLEIQETPSPATPGGMRGAGEVGIVGLAPVLAAAIERALKPLGLGHSLNEAPLTPNKIWHWIEKSYLQ